MALLRPFVVLVVSLRQGGIVAGSCPDGAKPFPPHLAGQGRKNYANLFDISYHGTYKVVEYSQTLSVYRGNHPDPSLQGKKIPPLVLYQCGTTRPSFGDDGIRTSEVRFFEIPLQTASLGWGGPLPFFELLSVTEAIRMMDLTDISSPCIQLLEECNPDMHMYSRNNSDWVEAASQSDVVFTDSFGTGWAGAEKDIPFQISLDPGTLKRAEWIRFVAAFFNEEDRADEVFTLVSEDYNALKSMGQQLSANKGTEWGGRQPRVAWVSIKSWDANQLVMTSSHFKADFVEAAGGRLVAFPANSPAGCNYTSNTDGSQTLECAPAGEGLASFKPFLKEADVIIDETYIWGYDTTAHDFPNSFKVGAGDVPALARDPPNIFRLDGTVSDTKGAEGSVGTHWYELQPSQPQQFLAGLLEAIWGDNFESPCGLKFLRRAIPGEGQTVLGASDCDYHDEAGNHDCDAIHEHVHKPPQCAEGAEVFFETNRAQGSPPACALAVTAALWSLLSWG